MSARRVALVVDHPQRDLAGLVLTAFELCQRGITCHLVPLNLQYSELWALAPDLVVLNYLRRYNEPVVRRLRQARIQYALLDTEGAVFSGPEEYAELHCEDGSLLRDAAAVCLWGPVLADWLVEHGAYARAQVAVTGCPRFDLYHPRWREAVWGVSAEPRNGGRILINTNFSVVNPRFTSPEENMEIYHRTLGWTRERIAAFTARERAAIGEVNELARGLAGRFPKARVVVRVHPHESPAPYRAALAGLANVEVNDSGAVQAQLFRANAVVQRSCTTAIESALAGAPTLSPRWVEPPMEAPMAEAVSVGCESREAMEQRVAEILEGRWAPSEEHRREVARVLEDWFHVQDGMAFRRVADALERALAPRRVDERRCRMLLYTGAEYPGRLSARLSRRLRWMLGLDPDYSFRERRVVPPTAWERSDKAFGVDEVRALVERMSGVWRASGWPARAVAVLAARDVGDYLRPGWAGHAVTMTVERAAD